MSAIKVSSVIEKVLDGSFGNGAIVKNSFNSKASADSVATDFVADYCAVDSWELDSTTGPAFTENVLDVIESSASIETVTFIHVQCYKKVVTATDKADPIRFELELLGNPIGKASQFQLGNYNPGAITTGDITVKAVEVPVNTLAILVVVIGFKKA